MPSSDKLFSQPIRDISDFTFDDNVASVFPDMITRSIPGYPLMIDNIGAIAARYAKPKTTIYDLGCATGIATLSIAKQIDPNCQVIGLDSSVAMVNQCKAYLNNYQHAAPINIELADITAYHYQPASMFVMNFTLQFLAPDQRQQMLETIYNALLPGGVLILSEKIRAEDPKSDDLLIDLHHQFKKHNGYSELEISQKRTALENVMLTDTLSTHFTRLRTAGFKRITPWFSCFNFMSLVAHKE
ncbi:MAG: carboxy-S-adenosyl-L-methionine synthase CmoA [Glaciecola sp.]|jgi:tRNA (cmo5U34)-methyltransferase